MASVLPWVCIVVFGGTMGHASPHTDLGLSIKPIFSSAVYIAKDPQTSEDLQHKEEQKVGQSQAAICEILNTTESGPDLHEVKTLPEKSFYFFVKPESSFNKLVVKLRLQNVLFISGNFYSDEDITINTKDLSHSGGNQWTHVTVEHYQYKRRGFDRHAFRVSFANITLTIRTHDSWIINGFKGFTVYAEGGAKLLFNCAPVDLNKAPVAGYVLYSMWVLAGLVIVASFLLAVLCFVYIYLKYQRRKKHAPVSPRKSPVYDEFDEEVLERLRQKVEALRSGKCLSDPDKVVVISPPRKENFYILEETGYGGVEGGNPEDHHYEEIEKNCYKQLYATDSVYQNLASVNHDGHNMSAVDNIYESLSCFENYLEKRGETS